jgi:Kdo2-lipid IVA lauroyltransferase/acyltransferase
VIDVWTRLSRAYGIAMRALVLLRDAVVTIPLVLVLLPIWWLPWRLATPLGRVYAWIAAAAWRSARRVGLINLCRAYGPSIDRREARRLMWTSFGNLGASLADGLQFSRRHRHGEPNWERLFDLEDSALAADLIARRGPIVFVTAHLGSWEVLLQLLSLAVPTRAGAIVRRVDNPFLNRLVRHVRLRDSDQWIEKRGALMDALGRLRRGEHVALLLDENGGRRGIFVDFFGRPASTSRAAALLALETGAEVIAGVAIRQPGPVPFLVRLARIEAPAAVDERERVHALTQRITNQIEVWVRQHPDQWRWIHWRWKRRPDGTEERYRSIDLRAAMVSVPSHDHTVPEIS